MIIPNAFDALVVTPSDTQPLVRPAQGTVAQTNANPNFIGAGQTGKPSVDLNTAYAISVAVAGNLVFVDKMGNTQTAAVPQNTMLYMRVTQVKATGTTATGIVAYFPLWQ